MPNNLFERFKSAYNVFRNKDPIGNLNNGMVTINRSTSPVYRHRSSYGAERSIVDAIYTRASIDISALKFRHVVVGQNGSFQDVVNSSFNSCLSLSSNLDQSQFAFFQDVVVSMFDEGVVALVPIDRSIEKGRIDDIYSIRTGKIFEWGPDRVWVKCYNEQTGYIEELELSKELVAIVENPLYSVMNRPNSTLQRLIAKLNILDVIDEQSGSGKLDVIIHLPYSVKNTVRLQQAEERRLALEEQLQDSKYGVGYIDSTESITQLNRPAENNLLKQVEYLTAMLYSQLGISEAILAGTANETEYLNYFTRTVDPIALALSAEMTRKFIPPERVAQGERITYFRDIFRYMTATALADLADKFTRNEILTSNEMRSAIGYRASDDPNADKLRNKNISSNQAQQTTEENSTPEKTEEEKPSFSLLDATKTDM